MLTQTYQINIKNNGHVFRVLIFEVSGRRIIPYIFRAKNRILMRSNAFIIGWLLLGLPFSCIWFFTTFNLTSICGP